MAGVEQMVAAAMAACFGLEYSVSASTLPERAMTQYPSYPLLEGQKQVPPNSNHCMCIEPTPLSKNMWTGGGDDEGGGMKGSGGNNDILLDDNCIEIKACNSTARLTALWAFRFEDKQW
eukprot:1936193-Pleurochrysis_carterae.AAC.2